MCTPATRPPSVATLATRDLQAYLPAPQRRQRPFEVHVIAYRGNPLPRPLDRLLRPRLVDLVDVLGGVGQHDHLIAPDIHEPTEDDVVVLLTASAVAKLTRLQRGHHGRMVREHA